MLRSSELLYSIVYLWIVILINRHNFFLYFRYGRKNEKNCIRNGLKELERLNPHESFKFSKAGLVFSTEQVGLAASPDGYITWERHGRGVVEAKCVPSHQHEYLKDVAQKNKDFFLNYDPEGLIYKFSLKHNHPYFYQVQTQMIVTETKFCFFMVYTDVDTVVAFVAKDPEVCDEIKTKSDSFFTNVLLPQMLSNWFVKPNYQPAIIPVQVLEDDEILEDYAQQLDDSTPTINIISSSSLSDPQPSTSRAVPNATDQPSQPTIGRTLYNCCSDGDRNSPTAECANIDCLVKVYHKSCVKPARKNFGKNWKCKPCVDLAKKQNKQSKPMAQKRNLASVDKENPVVPSKVKKQRTPLKVLQSNPNIS